MFSLPFRTPHSNNGPSEEALTHVIKGVTLAPEETLTAGRFRKCQDQSTVRNINVDSMESCNKRGGRNKKGE
jgi:hypothetical protein